MPRSVLLAGTNSALGLDWEVFASSTGCMSSLVVATDVAVVEASAGTGIEASVCSAVVT